VIGGAGDIGAAISNQFLRIWRDGDGTAANEADLARRRSQAAAGLDVATLDVTDDAASQPFASGTAASTRWSIAPAFWRATRNMRSKPS
jgi:NAD(P)-dependent dehydrogenase (short-subunit alcohol dehydrogenase family)